MQWLQDALSMKSVQMLFFKLFYEGSKIKCKISTDDCDYIVSYLKKTLVFHTFRFVA